MPAEEVPPVRCRSRRALLCPGVPTARAPNHPPGWLLSLVLHVPAGSHRISGDCSRGPPYPCKDLTQQCLRCWDLHQQRKSVRKIHSELKFQVVFFHSPLAVGLLYSSLLRPPCPGGSGSSEGLLRCRCRKLGVKPPARHRLSTPAEVLSDIGRRRNESMLTVTPVS